MKHKLYGIIFFTLFIPITAYSQVLQEDVYGTWIDARNEPDYNISLSIDNENLNLKWDSDYQNYTIIKWERINNINIDNNNEYPNGFKLLLQENNRTNWKSTPSALYIHKDNKNNLILEWDSDDNYGIFFRQ